MVKPVVLLDTCILVDIDKYQLDSKWDYQVSILSRAELEFGIRRAPSPGELAFRTKRLAEYDAQYDWLVFDEGASRAYGEIAAGASVTAARIRGKDALIAAQAYQVGAAVMTENVTDFKPFEKYIQILSPTSILPHQNDR
jgi:predicted nucleic acid-binding protein